MSDDRCSICRQPAHRVKLETSNYDVDCPKCGHYRISVARDLLEHSRDRSTLSHWKKTIAQANAEGDRLDITNGARIPL